MTTIGQAATVVTFYHCLCIHIKPYSLESLGDNNRAPFPEITLLFAKGRLRLPQLSIEK